MTIAHGVIKTLSWPAMTMIHGTHLMPIQNWMAAPENVWLRPLLPLGSASHCIALSSDTVGEPRTGLQ